VVTNRHFDVNLFENEIKVVESEASSFFASFNQINERTGQALYGDFGVGKIILGGMNNIKATTLFDVESLLECTYTPENAILIVMGDINYDVAALGVEEKFRSWEDCDTFSVEESVDNEPGVYFDGNFSTTNAVASLGFRVPYSDEREYICAELLSLIISDPLMSERIPFEVRQKRGLAYNVGGFVNQYQKMCTLGIACTSAASNTEEIIQIILDELRKVRGEGVLDVELNRAKMNLVTKRNLEFTDPFKRTVYLGKHSTYGQLYSFEDEIRKIRKIDLEYINSAVHRLFRNESMGLALIGKVDIDKIIDNLCL
jgi:Predicted Zn-dependent peptidases